jgi:hypothetical protein
VNKFGCIIYWCFICNFVEHKIYDCPHKDAVQAMLMENIVAIKAKNENAIVNIVLATTICN